MRRDKEGRKNRKGRKEKMERYSIGEKVGNDKGYRGEGGKGE